jgi:probable phosphoglycerate mutase
LEPTASDTTTILLVRHTDVHNPADVLYGRLPRFGLSDLGLRQADNTARALAGELITSFYTSPRLRARQTTRIIAQPHPGAPIRVTRLLDEVLTTWQGRPHQELETHGFNFYAHRLHSSDETLEQVWRRVKRFIERTRRRHTGETVVGVSHGDCVALARAFYSGMPVAIESVRRPNIYPGKGSITRLTFPDDLRETYPISIEYYDPNGHDRPWSEHWVRWPGGQSMPASSASQK